MKIKTLKDWHDSDATCFEDFFKAGDVVDESVRLYFFDILPPHRFDKYYLQTGEPHDHKVNQKTGKVAPRFMTFRRLNDNEWLFCGYCFTDEAWDMKVPHENVKEFLRNTTRIIEVCGLSQMETRPRIWCKDGYNISVQAGKFGYCTPRENLLDGAYDEVELGFPSADDELISFYAEDSRTPTETVYPYVPIEVVEALIEKHGGFE